MSYSALSSAVGQPKKRLLLEIAKERDKISQQDRPLEAMQLYVSGKESSVEWRK